MPLETVQIELTDSGRKSTTEIDVSTACRADPVQLATLGELLQNSSLHLPVPTRPLRRERQQIPAKQPIPRAEA